MSVDRLEYGDGCLLTQWMQRVHRGTWMARRPADAAGTVRFAFYGRVSTTDFQERELSRRWQRDAAEELVAGYGRIVAEHFDSSRSPRLSWTDRPQAAASLRRFADPERGFDAVVVGEYERAFCGSQLMSLLPLFEAHGVQLWSPEAHGPLDVGDASHRALVMLLGAQSKREVQRARWRAHRALVMLLGAQSKREVQRARWRAVQAMRGQARDEGRFLGGRPLLGYRLVDAGPHPNPMHAKWGRRLQRYDPDPVTAPTVRWIFAERLRGRSVSSIAAELNGAGVPCPSSVDRARNRHRTGTSWGLTTVRAILMNAKYTGRQVWNRQPAYYTPAHLPGPFRTQRWAQADQWVVSRSVVHPPLVSEADFVAVQAVRAHPAPSEAVLVPPRLTSTHRHGWLGGAADRFRDRNQQAPSAGWVPSRVASYRRPLPPSRFAVCMAKSAQPSTVPGPTLPPLPRTWRTATLHRTGIVRTALGSRPLSVATTTCGVRVLITMKSSP